MKKILVLLSAVQTLVLTSAFAAGPPEVPRDPFNVTWYGRCGEDDLRAGRDTMEEMQRLVRQANERATRLAQEAMELSCRPGAEAAAERAALRLAAEANERACAEVVEAANESLWRRLGRRCGFYAVGAACSHLILAEAAAECAVNPTVMGNAEWPPANSCEGLANSLRRIIDSEMRLREQISAATRDKELAAMTIARLSMMSSLTLLQETELRSARVSLESAERRLEGLLEQARDMERNNSEYKNSIVAELARCRGGLYPEPPASLVPTPSPTPTPSVPNPSTSIPGPRPTPSVTNPSASVIAPRPTPFPVPVVRPIAP